MASATPPDGATLEQLYARAQKELEEKNRALAELVERLADVERLKASFLQTVSHELRTPLTSVLGYAEMLLEGLAGPLTGEQREYVRTIMEKGDQLLGLISGLLEISRIEAGPTTLSRQNLAVAQLLEQVMGLSRAQAARKRIIVQLEVPSDLPEVSIDRDKAQRAVANILGNAVKFTPEGGTIFVRAAQSGPWVEVVVVDSGIGIPATALPHIFDAFYQADSSSTREHGGAGLGLTIARSLIEAHGGGVRVESTVGQGTTVTVSLPTAVAEGA